MLTLHTKLAATATATATAAGSAATGTAATTAGPAATATTGPAATTTTAAAAATGPAAASGSATAGDHAAGSSAAAAPYATLTLPYELREKCRLRAVLGTGEEAAVFTVRGTVLRDGDLLVGEDRSKVVRVVAAREPTYKVTCADAHALLRCAFHLGNRHTQAQVGDGFLRIRADVVLKDMLAGLGATVVAEDAPFEPESGAYGGGHGHGHDSHGGHGGHPLAPIPLRQRIHRPGDSAP